MNPVRLLIIVLGVMAATLFVVLPVTFARRLSSKRAARRVKHHAAKAVEALKDLTSDQRDEAVEQARATMNELDERIEILQESMYSKWDQMDQTSREKTKSTLSELTKKRNQVAEWYGALSHSTAEAWNDVKEGFMESYKTLSVSFQAAQSKFSS